MGNTLSTVHERIAFARWKAHLDQKTVASTLNISPGNYSKIERGLVGIKCESLVKMSELFRLDIRYYFGMIDYEEAEELAKEYVMGNKLSDVLSKRSLLIMRNALQNHLEILKQGAKDFGFKADGIVMAFREEEDITVQLISTIEKALRNAV